MCRSSREPAFDTVQRFVECILLARYASRQWLYCVEKIPMGVTVRRILFIDDKEIVLFMHC